MRPYDHGGDIDSHPGVTLDFSVNLNPLGMPPQVKAALAAGVEGYARYPDPFCRALCRMIGERAGLPAENVLCGAGAAELIWRLCLALRPNRVLVSAPTFSEYEKAARFAGAAVAVYALPAQNGFLPDERLLQAVEAGVDVVFFCNPNNPTGRLADAGLLRRLLERCEAVGALLVVDECFLPFTDGVSLIPLLAGHPRLCVLRAFTKLYAMAGLRLGCLLAGDEALLSAVAGAGQCWGVSVPAQLAGEVALSCKGWGERTRALVAEERGYLSQEMAALGLTVCPSEANFLLFSSPVALREGLLKRGILLRDCSNFAGLGPGWYRLGLKTRAENRRLLAALGEVLHG